jgi:hypothetical protein
MSRKVARITAIASFIIFAGLTSTVASAQGLLVRIGTPDLSIDRVTIIVPLTVSCAPFDVSLTHYMSEARVTIQQAAGREIARGSASVSSFVPAVLFPCDGTEHTLTLAVLADPLGPPFHGGPAAVAARVTASAGIPCFPGSTTCFVATTAQVAVLGPTTVHLR